MKWSRKKAISDIAVASASQYIAQVILFLRNFIFAKLLGPHDFGIYASIFLFFSYGNYANFGMIDGVSRIVPYELGAGNEKKARDILGVGLWGLNLTISFFVIAVIFYSLTSPLSTIAENKTSVILAGVAVLLNQNFLYVLTYLRLKHEFKRSYLMQFMQALVDLVISIVLMLKFKVVGIFWGMTIGLLVMFIFSLRDILRGIKLKINFGILKSIFNVGFQILLVGFTYGFLMSADKFSVANLFEKSKMGIYSVAVGLGMIPYFASATLGQFIGQRMLEEYGKTKTKESLKIFLDESLLVIAFLTPLISILTIAFAEPFIHLFLPKYIDSLRIVDKLAIAYYFISLGAVLGTFLITINQQGKILILNLIFIPTVLFLNYLSFKANLNLLGISYVTFLNFFIRTLFLFLLSYGNYSKILTSFFKFVKFSLASIPIVIAFGLKFLTLDAYLKFYLRILIAFFWFVFSMYYLSRKTEIVSTMLGILKKRLVLYTDKFSDMF